MGVGTAGRVALPYITMRTVVLVSDAHMNAITLSVIITLKCSSALDRCTVDEREPQKPLNLCFTFLSFPFRKSKWQLLLFILSGDFDTGQSKKKIIIIEKSSEIQIKKVFNTAAAAAADRIERKTIEEKRKKEKCLRVVWYMRSIRIARCRFRVTQFDRCYFLVIFDESRLWATVAAAAAANVHAYFIISIRP